jgi:2-keto-4-pentenoate hydratase/2-oxohepta-3-ene-1,7-dioic acid hydratase in catechol pathway
MRLATYNARGRTGFGVVEGDGVIDLRTRLSARYATLLDVLRAGALDEVRQMVAGVRPDFPLTEVELLTPLLAPEKILCIGINYNRQSEYKDMNPASQSGYCSMFFRTPGSLVGHEQPILLPRESEQLDYEGEIALVIGREGRRVTKEKALDYIMGFTLCNEGCLRDWMRHGKFNVTQGKNFDASGSLGPWIVTTDELSPTKNMHLTTKVNGELRQDTMTSLMMLGFADLIAYVTKFTTLKPGDIISTGTPVGTGMGFDPPKWLKAGDVVEVTVPEIGTLRNKVKAEI